MFTRYKGFPVICENGGYYVQTRFASYEAAKNERRNENGCRSLAHAFEICDQIEEQSKT